MRLQYHLQDQQVVRFPGNDRAASEARLRRASQTQLTEYFATVRRDLQSRNEGIDHPRNPAAYQLTYLDFPLHYTWDTTLRTWTRRSRRVSNLVSRMYSARPGQGERFFLRCLLAICEGVTSFEHLRQHQGVTHATYRDACVARGLFADDREWHDAMEVNYNFTPLNMTVVLLISGSQRILDGPSVARSLREHFAHRQRRAAQRKLIVGALPFQHVRGFCLRKTRRGRPASRTEPSGL